ADQTGGDGMSISKTRATAMTAALLCSAAASPTWAQVSPEPVNAESEHDTSVTIDRVRALEARIEALEVLLDMHGVAIVGDDVQATMRGRGLQPAGADGAEPQGAGASESEAQTAENDRKAPAPSEAVEAVAQREQGYFGERLSLELGVSYAHFDDARVNLSGFLALDAIFLGLISIDETQADVITTDLTARLGIDDRLQFD